MVPESGHHALIHVIPKKRGARTLCEHMGHHPIQRLVKVVCITELIRTSKTRPIPRGLMPDFNDDLCVYACEPGDSPLLITVPAMLSLQKTDGWLPDLEVWIVPLDMASAVDFLAASNAVNALHH